MLMVCIILKDYEKMKVMKDGDNDENDDFL
jgi:hypothetical protein